MMTATTNRKYFNELLKTPLFFMEQKRVHYEKRSRNCIETEDHYFYKSAQPEISASISDETIVNEILRLNYVLLVAGNEVENNQNEPSDTVTFSFHIADPRHRDDWIIILNSLITRSQNSEDKFPFIFTLWFLNHSDWNIDQLKSAFKTLYGLFDKTAYFINAYFDLGIRERDVSFSHIWFSEYGSGKKQYSYKNVLNHKENFALASLYWISRDFYDKFEDSPNPHLRRISDVRNALEHKYVKVTKGWFPERENGEIDDLAFYVTEDELSTLTLELMRIIRETIICLSLCVHEEERKRHPDKDKKMIMSVPLMEYDDDWKI